MKKGITLGLVLLMLALSSCFKGIKVEEGIPFGHKFRREATQLPMVFNAMSRPQKSSAATNCGLYEGIPFGRKFCREATLLPEVMQAMSKEEVDQIKEKEEGK